MNEMNDREVQHQPGCCTLLFCRDKGQSSLEYDIWRRRMFCKQVGAKIAYYRTLLAMPQEALAKKANVTPSALRRIERGRGGDSLSLLLLLDIAEGLRVDVSRLVGLCDP